MAITSYGTFKTLDQIARDDESETGGKAFNCGRLKQAGFAVPPGLVVLAGATPDDIDRAPDHPWLHGHPPGTRFAVRSSGIGEDGAGHSFAGVHETFLHVERADIADAVRRCRRSVHSEQASVYRQSRHIGGGELRTGVLIQPMVAALTSGVVFTVNPVTGANELVINAAAGLGEALVSGTIDPDELHVDRISGHVVASRPGTGGEGVPAGLVLPEPAIAELARLAVGIERFFGPPQDIEWCHDGHQFWVLQSRPVTAAEPRDASETEWTRANLAEVFPDQMSPQALDVYEDMLNRAEARFMGRLLAPGLGPMVKNFHGRLYFNLSQLRHVTRLGGAAPAGVLRSLGHSDAIEPADEVRTRPALTDVLPRLPDFIRIALNDRRAPRLMQRQERALEAITRRFASADLDKLSDAAIWQEIADWQRVAPDYVQLVLLLGSVLFDEEILRSACRRVGCSYDGLVYPQLAAGERSVSTQQAFDLVALADVARRDPIAARYFSSSGGRFDGFRDALGGTAFLPAFERFIDQYGHRGHYESDWAIPRYREDPTAILFAIQSHLAGDRPEDLAETTRRLEAQGAEAWRSFEARANWWQKLTLVPRVKATIRRLKHRYLMREKARSDLTRMLAEVRRWHLALAGRFVMRGWLVRRDDYFLLHFREVEAAAHDPARGPTLAAVVEVRAAQMAAERPMRMPLLMRESALGAALRRAAFRGSPGSTRLDGLCVSPGCVEAEVVVILDPRDFQQMRPGAILVAPATDPSWTPLFTLAAGVIVEVGGMLSHASTIAREYGLPALANVKDATRRLHTGERVRLDATGGFVAPFGADEPAPAPERAGML